MLDSPAEVEQNVPNNRTINDYLPNEMLEQIFCRISSSKDLCNTKLVCQRWRLVVDEVIGHSVEVTSFSDLTSRVSRKSLLTVNLRPLQILKEHPHMGIRDLTVGVSGMLIDENLTERIQQLAQTMESFPRLSFPHILRNLTCLEPIPKDTLSNLAFLKNLVDLNLSLFSLSNLTESKYSVRLPSLLSLTISEVPTYPEFNSSTVIGQLNNYLDGSETPKLKCLHVSCPILNLTDIENDSTRHVMNFLRRSANSVKSLSISVSSPSQNFSPLSKTFQYSSEILEEMRQLGTHVQLKSAKLQDNHLHSLRPSTQVKGWTALIKTQQALEYLNLYLKSSIEFAEDVVPILQKNVTTLKTLHLSCFPSEVNGATRDVSFVPINCEYFQSSTALTTLRVTDKLINTMELPRSLRYIYVDAMLTNADASNILLCDHFLLDRIELKDTRGGAPKGFGYGIPISTLTSFVENRKCKRLTIYAGSTDGIYPKEGIHSGDNVEPIYLHKRRYRLPRMTLNGVGNLVPPPEDFERFLAECVRIDWQLNQHGFYESVDEDNQRQNIKHDMFSCENLIVPFH